LIYLPFILGQSLNPLQGHVQATRSIHNPEVLETLRELSAMDGAFIVSRRGVVDSAGDFVNLIKL